MITTTSTLSDVAFHVCTALDRAGITAVLPGGRAATFYAPDAYQSRDIDFVIKGRPRATHPGAIQRHRRMGDHGFYQRGPLREAARALLADAQPLDVVQ